MIPSLEKRNEGRILPYHSLFDHYRTFFVPTTSAHAVTRTDESEKSQKRLPLTRPYWMALRCSSLMIGIAARPSTTLSVKLMTPRAKSKAIITHPNGETRVPCCFRRTRVSISSDMHFLLLCLRKGSE